jgi:hypothetical protein
VRQNSTITKKPTKKNLSFSLENNTVNTYIHPNDRKPVRSEPISPPSMFNVTFSEFNEIDLLNWKNNYSTSGQSGYTSNNPLFNSPFNSLSVLTEIKSPLTPLFSVFSLQGSEQHLYPLNVFSPTSFYFSTFNSKLSN